MGQQVHIIHIAQQTTSVSFNIGEDISFKQTTHNVHIMEQLPTSDNRLTALLVTAINNRTRERNYFRLCLQLANGEISDSEFDDEINNNEDDYAISTDQDVSPDEIRMLLDIAPGIKGLDSLEDLQDTFSINPSSTRKALEQQNGNVH